MRLETGVKNCEEQLNNALKRRSAQFHKNKKPRFVNTQTSPTCLSRKKKQKKRPSSAVSTSLSQRVAAKTEGDEDERFSLSKWSGGKMSI